MSGITEETVSETGPKILGTTVTYKRVLLVLSCFLFSVGGCVGPLITRLYYIHGGKRVWLTSFLQSAGWPIALIALALSYFHRRTTDPNAEVFYSRYLAFFAAAIIGVLTGLDNYLYSYGLACLPVSTCSLIVASQLAFTAAFAFVLVKQKFTPYSINAVVLLTVGAGILALHSNSDKPEGESSKQYILGFVMSLGSALLYGLILPLIELTYMKAKQEISFTFVMEINLVLNFCSSTFCLIGMIVNNDFQAIAREATTFDLGETRFYVVLVWTAIIWQCFFVGAVGVIFCGSSLLSGIISTVLLPITEVLAVIVYQENFSGEKGVSLGLSLWGFFSYSYGEARQIKKQKKMNMNNNHLETEMPRSSTVPNQTSNI
uniref:Probable purine permease n=1 Tax=Rhizophora mucronata TaxID=61149 RepID=A0A2P2QQ94_RHIMU